MIVSELMLSSLCHLLSSVDRENNPKAHWFVKKHWNNQNRWNVENTI